MASSRVVVGDIVEGGAACPLLHEERSCANEALSRPVQAGGELLPLAIPRVDRCVGEVGEVEDLEHLDRCRADEAGPLPVDRGSHDRGPRRLGALGAPVEALERAGSAGQVFAEARAIQV